jgi:hypothetical protein
MEISNESLQQYTTNLGTVVDPSVGLMSGICWEAQQDSEVAVKRWYEVQDGFLCWYDLEERSQVSYLHYGSQPSSSRSTVEL